MCVRAVRADLLLCVFVHTATYAVFGHRAAEVQVVTVVPSVAEDPRAARVSQPLPLTMSRMRLCVCVCVVCPTQPALTPGREKKGTQCRCHCHWPKP